MMKNNTGCAQFAMAQMAISKISAPEELISVIRKIVAGGKYISPMLAERLADTFTGKVSEKPHEKLSSREYQVMCLIAKVKSVEKLANCSP